MSNEQGPWVITVQTQISCYITQLQIRCIILTYIDAVHVIYLPNPMLDHLLESSHRDDFNKQSNMEFGKEI